MRGTARQRDADRTHKPPFNALPGIPNSRRLLILAKRSLDRSPKPTSKGKKWDKAVYPDEQIEWRLSVRAGTQPGPKPDPKTCDLEPTLHCAGECFDGSPRLVDRASIILVAVTRGRLMTKRAGEPRAG